MDRRKQKTKAAIQKAYFSLLMEKKETRITIAEIARRADIDRKTFYLHYNSVEDILREFSGEKVRELLVLLENDGFFEHPFDVHLLFSDLNDLIIRNIDFYEHLIHTSAFDFIWEEMQKLLLKTIKEVYAGIVDVSPEELDVYAHFYASGVVETYVAWLKGDISLDINRLGEVVADVTYFGAEEIIAASNGRQKPEGEE